MRLARLAGVAVAGAVLAGMSQGGFLSLRAALASPERIQALVLMGSQAGLEDPEKQASYEVLHQVWLDQGPEPVQEIVAGIILGEGEWASWYAKWATWAERDRNEFTHAFRCLSDRDDITERLGEITCPTLVIHGTADAADRGVHPHAKGDTAGLPEQAGSGAFGRQVGADVAQQHHRRDRDCAHHQHVRERVVAAQLCGEPAGDD